MLSTQLPISMPRLFPFCRRIDILSAVMAQCGDKRKGALKRRHGLPLVKNLPSNAGDVGWIPGWGTKIPLATGQLPALESLLATRAPVQKPRPILGKKRERERPFKTMVSGCLKGKSDIV